MFFVEYAHIFLTVGDRDFIQYKTLISIELELTVNLEHTYIFSTFKEPTGELLWNADHLLKWKSFWLAYYPIYPVVGEGLRRKAVYCTNSPAVSPPRNRFQDPGQLSPAPTVTVHRCAFIKTYIRAVIGNRWHIFT